MAASDGEIGSWSRHALDRHLARCASCRAEQVSTQGLLAALRTLPVDAEVPARLEHDVLRAVRILSVDQGTQGQWGRLQEQVRRMAPVLAVGVVAALAVLTLRGAEQAPMARQATPPARRTATATSRDRPVIARRPKTTVPSDPPAALASHPDLFIDLRMLRNLEKLRHYDAVATMEEDDPTAPSDGDSPSNG